MVDLPQPLGPTSATNSWSFTLRSVGRNASSSPPRTTKRLLAPARRIFSASGRATGATLTGAVTSDGGIAPPQQISLHPDGGFRNREAEQHQNDQRRIQ